MKETSLLLKSKNESMKCELSVLNERGASSLESGKTR